MTENERLTIDEIIQHCNRTCENTEMLATARGQNQEDITSKGYWEHYQVANYLEELKQYRAIGTVEKIKEELDRLRNDNECQGLYFTLEERQDLARKSRELSEYKAIGTAEEFKALKEKSVAKKAIERERNYLTVFDCPTCNAELYSGQRYCDECGQALET